MRRAEDILDDAEDSLGAAKDLLNSGRWAKACFMAQQTAELAAKAALNALGKERKGHDVFKLVQELSQYKQDVLALLDDAKLLDQYYIPTRYANAFSEGSARLHFTEKQASEAVEIAEKILTQVRCIISGGRAC